MWQQRVPGASKNPVEDGDVGFVGNANLTSPT